MFVAKQNNDRYTPGTWRGVTFDGKRFAGLTCPNGHAGDLSDHTIAADGTVSPSVVCPEAGCGFHENVKLEGWTSNVLQPD